MNVQTARPSLTATADRDQPSVLHGRLDTVCPAGTVLTSGSGDVVDVDVVENALDGAVDGADVAGADEGAGEGAAVGSLLSGLTVGAAV